MKTAKHLFRMFWDVAAIIGCITAAVEIVRDICRLEHGFLLGILSALIVIAAILAILDLLTTIMIRYMDWKHEAVTPLEITD